MYISTKAGVQQWLGGRLWDKEDKAERLLKSSPWRELLDVSDRASVSESLWEAHVKQGFWRGRDCASGACMRASERQEKASDNKWTSQEVGGCSQALVTATRVISKRTALLCQGKGYQHCWKDRTCQACQQLGLVPNLCKPRGLLA